MSLPKDRKGKNVRPLSICPTIDTLGKGFELLSRHALTGPWVNICICIGSIKKYGVCHSTNISTNIETAVLPSPTFKGLCLNPFSPMNTLIPNSWLSRNTIEFSIEI